jgi:steroid delta-isomerase
MTSPELMRHAVEEYLRLLEDGTADELTALFSADASLSDPAGDPPKTGAEIRAHFELAVPYEMTTKLLALRIAGHSAAAYFQVTTRVEDDTYLSSPIDVFTFDDEGKVTSLSAYWGPDDYTAAAGELAQEAEAR